MYHHKKNNGANVWEKIGKRVKELRIASESLKIITKEEKERIFKERAQNLSRVKIKYTDSENLAKIISFYLADELYGIDVNYLQEIFEVKSITKIPCTSHFLSGLINFRGAVLTVINLKTLFDLQEEKNIENEIEQGVSGPKKILILDHLGIKVGLEMDRYAELLELSRDRIYPVSTIFLNKNVIIKSETRIKGKPLLIIDPDALLNDSRLFLNEDI